MTDTPRRKEDGDRSIAVDAYTQLAEAYARLMRAPSFICCRASKV
jgi:hypothetical protein